MRANFHFSNISSFYFCLLFVALFHPCLSETLCIDVERQALLELKHGLIDEFDRLASWVGDKSDCCKWAGIVCDNVTGHIHQIHLPGNCNSNYNSTKEYEEIMKQRLKGGLSPSILNLKQLNHLDLSCNDFGGIQVPIFMGSLGNLRYLNLSRSNFGGTIPPQLGNLTELRILCLGSFYDVTDEPESTSMMNTEWLSSLRWLHHLDMSGVDLSKALDWFQVINTLPSLAKLHFSNSQLLDIHPHVASFNHTSLSVLDLSRNPFNNRFMPQWIFSITGLVALDLTSCGFVSPIPSSIRSFRNMTSLKFLHVSGNNFMNSSLVLQELSSIGSNLISLDISSCSVSSSILDAVHNLSSLIYLDLSENQLTKTIPKSLGSLCNLRDIDLSENGFGNISLTSLLESFFKCKSPSLESLSLESSQLSSYLPDQLGQLINLVQLQLGNNHIVGTIPDSIGRLSFLRYLDLDENLISGPIPFSIGGLSSLETLDLSNNQLNGSLPDSIGQLAKLTDLDISFNLLTGVVTEAHFVNLTGLKYLKGIGNNLTLRANLETWIPPFQLQYLYLSSWDLGPQFPLWLLLQRDLILLEIQNTKISSTMPESFWKSLPNLQYLDMSQNQMQGRLFGIPATLVLVDLSSNKFSGILPELFNSSLLDILDLSNNSFTGSLHHLLCPYGGQWLEALNLADNHLAGVIPECWVKWPKLIFLNLENNNFSGGIPTSLGSLSSLGSLNMCNNKLSGRLPDSLQNLTELKILQFATNQLVGSIPAWFGTQLSSLKILNLRSNNFGGNLTRELCYLTTIQILDLAHNNLSGNIPRCFNNFSVLSKKETPIIGQFVFLEFDNTDIVGSASLVTKGQEYTYSSILGLVMVVDLSSNKFSGSIPSEIMALKALQSLNLSRNQLTGRIPENIGDLHLLDSFDASLNQLSGELPVSLSRLTFLSTFNVSFNSLTGRIPTSTQIQGFNESSFYGNKLCGVPLTQRCDEVLPNREQEESDGSHGVDWGLIISILSGFAIGFLVSVAPWMARKIQKIASFRFLK